MVVAEAHRLWDRGEVTIMIEELTGLSLSEQLIFMNTELSAETEKKLKEWIEKRKDGAPLQQLLGKWWFYGLELKITQDVLIPRPETELLIELAVTKSAEGSKILDLCTGTGAIAIALSLNVKDSEVIATDLSCKALEVAEYNVELNSASGVKLMQGDLFEPVRGTRFDLIVSNPPYINLKDMESLSREVLHEPKMALYGGEDGLDFYRRIISESPEHLNPGGYLILEIGYDQSSGVEAMMKNSGFIEIETKKDYGNFDRIVIGRLSDK